jgi:hypothetical protein
MTNAEIINKVKKLKPTINTLSNLTTVTPTGSRSNFTIYKDDSFYYIAKGMIISERQNHEIVKKAKNYNSIIDFFLSQTNS